MIDNDYKETWDGLEKEYLQLEASHKEYCKKVEDVKSVQKKCMKAIESQRYRMKQLTDSIKRLEKHSSDEEKVALIEMKKKIETRKPQFRELEDVLPHENGLYLKVILGSVNVSLLSKIDKYKYKEDYERFKLVLSIIILVYAILLWFIDLRVTDAAFQFLLVWYYCTLTIREHILKVNGSRIKGWWITHHFVSTACAGILLIWPVSYTYTQFRGQFIVFSIYLSLVQLVQYYYQSGMLYRLRALGERHNMDITVEGFTSWMWKGLTFVLPFLVMGYLFQLYNAYVLVKLHYHPDCREWQVLTLSAIFFTLFLGNTWTTMKVIRHKIVSRTIETEAVLRKYKFSSGSNLANQNPSPTATVESSEEPKPATTRPHFE